LGKTKGKKKKKEWLQIQAGVHYYEA
jgi:hypothetical protein